MNTAIYVRVSTDDQNTGSQEHELHAYCDRRGWRSTDIYSDQISGAKFVRPGLDALMAAVRPARSSGWLCSSWTVSDAPWPIWRSSWRNCSGMGGSHLHQPRNRHFGQQPGRTIAAWCSHGRCRVRAGDHQGARERGPGCGQGARSEARASPDASMDR